jgi:hypothetical protein
MLLRLVGSLLLRRAAPLIGVLLGLAMGSKPGI